MIDLDELKGFLAKANMPHADGSAPMIKETDGSRTIVFEDGPWSMHDNFFGGEPYGGRQIVLYDGEPVWLCVYYGFVAKERESADDVYDFLREALQYPPEAMPLRGASSYKRGNFEYRHEVPEDITSFESQEVILENGKQIYWAKLVGGLVDQRFKGSV
jgi:hypothetical protein